MRAEEFVLPEISRMSSREFSGGKNTLAGMGPRKLITTKPLPGGSRFQYHIREGLYDKSIMIFDPEMPTPKSYRGAQIPYYIRNPIGYLTIDKYSDFPIQPAYQVGWITVDDDYRGQGIAKSLYGIVLAVMGLTLVSDGSQTPGGRRNWVSMYKIPGAEVHAYIVYSKGEINEKVENILKQAGAKAMGESDRFDLIYYSLPVRMRPDSRELALLTTKLKLYGSSWDQRDIGLYARFKGSQG